MVDTMFKIGDMVWVVVETDIGFQVQHLPIIDTRTNSKREVWLYFVGDLTYGYESWQVHEYQEDAINEVVDRKLDEIREG